MVYNFIICLTNRYETTRPPDIKMDRIQLYNIFTNRYNTTRPPEIIIDGIQLYNMFN